jgi:hypothetical protein
MERDDVDDLESMKKTAGWFSRIFSTPDGAAALAHLKERFFVGDTTLAYDAEGRLDPVKMAAREGQRSVVLYIADLAAFDFTAANGLIEEFCRQAEKAEEHGV